MTRNRIAEIALICLIVVASISLVLASQTNSSNFAMSMVVLNSGGTNTSSTNFNHDLLLGTISGNITSANFLNSLGFFYTILWEQDITVYLVSPATGTSVSDSNVTLRCNATSTNGKSLKNISLYTNVSGSWLRNSTIDVREVQPDDDDLVLLMHFNNDSSVGENQTFVYDWSGVGNDGNCSGTVCPSWTGSGRFAGAFEFDGINDYFEVSGADFKGYNTSGAIVLWAYPRFGNDGAHHFMFDSRDSGDNYGFAMSKSDSGNNDDFACGWRNTSGSQDWDFYDFNWNTEKNKWHHFAMSWDSATTTKRCYIDGVMVINDTSATNFPVTVSSQAAIGSYRDKTNYLFNGTIDEFAVRNRSLTAAEIMAIYNYTKTKYQANFSLTGLDIGSYKWNCLAYDNASQSDWDDANWTFGITNQVPIVSSGPTITPTDPKPYNNLTCTFTVEDGNPDTLYANYTWYNGTTAKFKGQVQVTNSTPYNLNLSYLNTTYGDTWNCSITPYDGTEYGTTKSDSVHINNTVPTVTLIWPNDGNDTTDYNRTPGLLWDGTDADGDPLNFTILIECMAADCGGYLEKKEINVTAENWTLNEELEVDVAYNWTVRAFDGINYSSWSTVWNFTVASNIAISLQNDRTSFGSVQRLEQYNTTVAGDSFDPLVVRNDGNVFADIMARANNSLWATQTLNTSSFQFSAGNASTGKAFNWSGSQINWTNVTDYNMEVIEYLNYTDTRDNGSIELKITVPYDESPGTRYSKIIITGEPS